MLRGAARFSCALCFWLLVITVVFWIRGRWVDDTIELNTIKLTSGTFQVTHAGLYLYSGRIAFSWEDKCFQNDPEPAHERYVLRGVNAPSVHRTMADAYNGPEEDPAFAYSRRSSPLFPFSGNGQPVGMEKALDVTFPLWLPASVFALPPLLWLFFLWWRRPRRGHCAECGYDLRASKDRCPECGTAIGTRKRHPVRWMLVALLLSLIMLAGLGGGAVLAVRHYLARDQAAWREEKRKEKAESLVSPMYEAIHTDDIGAIRKLIEQGGDVRLISLADVIEGGHILAARFLIEAGADLEKPSSNGNTPLAAAIANKYPLMARRLIERGANVKVKLADGRSLLHLCPMGPELEIEELLIAHGADVNAVDDQDLTPLQRAIADSSRPLLAYGRLLCAHGANPNVRDRNGSTPLHYAVTVSAAGLEWAKMLMEYGGDPNIRDAEGKTALGEARSLGQNEMVEVLMRKRPGVARTLGK